MKAHLPSNGTSAASCMTRWTENVPFAAWAVLGLPIIYIAHALFVTIVPTVLHAVVPDVVRTVLHMI